MRILLPVREKLYRQLGLAFWCITAVLIVVTKIAALYPAIERANLAAFDVAESLAPQHPAKHVQIISITQRTLDTQFKGKTPEDAPAILLKAIYKLAEYKPAVIAVDILTDSSGYQRVFEAVAAPASLPPVVWARGLDEGGRLRSVLGGKGDAVALWGVPGFVPDPDFIIRKFTRGFGTSGTAIAPSLHWAALKAYCGVLPDKCTSEVRESAATVESFYFSNIVSSARLYDMPLEDLLSSTDSPDPDNRLRNKILLVGGYYGSDVHTLSRGSVPGVELTEAAIESELTGSPLREALFPYEISIEVTLAILIGLAHKNLMPRAAGLASIMITVLAIVVGHVAVARYSYVTNFLLLGFGAWIEQLYETIESAHEHASAAGHSP